MLAGHVDISADFLTKIQNKLVQESMSGQNKAHFAIFLALFIGVALLDFIHYQNQLIIYHAAYMIFMLLFLNYQIKKTLRKQFFGKSPSGIRFYCELNDEGVAINRSEQFVRWDEYEQYEDFDDYIEITKLGGETTYLPKTAELAEIINFTKSKIPNNQINKGQG